MKSQSQTRVKIIEINFELSDVKDEYDSLGQIDMLSSTGNQLLEKINKLQGWKEALIWVWDNDC